MIFEFPTLSQDRSNLTSYFGWRVFGGGCRLWRWGRWVIFGHVALDCTLTGRGVAADGAAPGTAGNVAFQMPFKVAFHRRLVRALGAREHRFTGVTRPVRAPLDAAVGDEPWTVRAPIDQPSGVARFHVRRHLPLVSVGVAAIATPEQPTARRQRLIDCRTYRRRSWLIILAKFHFRFSAGQLCFLAIQVRR